MRLGHELIRRRHTGHAQNQQAVHERLALPPKRYGPLSRLPRTSEASLFSFRSVAILGAQVNPVSDTLQHVELGEQSRRQRCQ
jgi:hypothetical protein